jgi:hypothetical protein
MSGSGTADEAWKTWTKSNQPGAQKTEAACERAVQHALQAQQLQQEIQELCRRIRESSNFQIKKELYEQANGLMGQLTTARDECQRAKDECNQMRSLESAEAAKKEQSVRNGQTIPGDSIPAAETKAEEGAVAVDTAADGGNGNDPETPSRNQNKNKPKGGKKKKGNNN